MYTIPSPARWSVAPRAGAWIETTLIGIWLIILMKSLPVRERGLKLLVYSVCVGECKSLPVRERGLKRLRKNILLMGLSVAPRAGAWIETPQGGNDKISKKSLPVRERGLKQKVLGVLEMTEKSLPVRERGLKPVHFLTYRASICRSPCGSVD